MDDSNAFSVMLLGSDMPVIPTLCPAGVMASSAPATAVRCKRRPWKCNREWLMSNITEEERQKLLERNISVPKVWKPTMKMTHAKERMIRTALRKVRNVASAQRHRETQRTRVTMLETQLSQRDDTIRELVARISQLESVIMTA